MTRKTKVLSGASQEAYFRRVLETCPDLADAARDALLRRLRQDITQLRVRTAAKLDDVATGETEPAPEPSTTSSVESDAPAQADDIAQADAFDPFALNVLVTLRQQGRDAALEALKAIANADHLRLLAREQRLSIDDALASSTDLSAAIVSAAERISSVSACAAT